MIDTAVTEEEADLLLGGMLPELLPAAPAESRPVPGDQDSGLPESTEVTAAEADALLGESFLPGGTPDATPGPAGSDSPARSDDPFRSGASGAAILNDLVDEIEKDLERDTVRHIPAITLPDYGQTIGCWSARTAAQPDEGSAVATAEPDEETSK